LKDFENNYFGSFGTDPPYGLGFMNRTWDAEVPGPEYWSAILRVCKPGAYGYVFGGRRKFHHLMSSLEDAGWHIRDTLLWMYATGHPKVANVPVLADKKAGVLGHRGAQGHVGRHEPITDFARRWDGYATGLKPAFEPIVLVQKPTKLSIVANLERYGVGALNIDPCRIPRDWSERPESWKKSGHSKKRGGKIAAPPSTGINCDPLGSWPANVLMTYEKGQDNPLLTLEALSGNPLLTRIFWCKKASRKEKEAGLEHFKQQVVKDGRKSSIDNPFQRGATERCNTVVTVKPEKLIRYLTQLTTPPAETTLDPFCGSGTAGVSAARLGISFVGIDNDADPGSVAIARARIAHAVQNIKLSA
jgi:site-specific DNA-methyltransferase (adenine-specific)